MLIGGPLVCVCAYMALGGFGGPAGQVVHASPDKTYSAFADSFSDIEQSGIVESKGGPVAYQIEVNRVRDKSIDVVWEISGEKAGHLRLGFAPQGQNDTYVSGTMIADSQKIRDTLGYSTAGFPDAPAFVMNVGLKSILSDAAKKIEDGMPLDKFGKRIAVSNGDRSASGRNYADEARQRAATQPMLDPDADARRYLHRGY
jgi:hypothetical protein